jgi:hypothetical protein
MMAWVVSLLAIAAYASGYVSGRISARERLYRRYWQRPVDTLDEIRAEARSRYL